MTVIQYHNDSVTFQFGENQGRRRIPFGAERASRLFQPPPMTSLPGDLTCSEGRKHISFNIEQGCQIIQLPKITDRRGSLSFIEGERHLPFKIQSACWLDEVSTEVASGNYARRGQDEFIIVMSGSLEIIANHGGEKKRYLLDRPDFGLYVPNRVWRRIESGSANAVALILASQPHRAEDYVASPDESKELAAWQ